jgi:PAT family beta-lactamase induction signal transducer AmpG
MIITKVGVMYLAYFFSWKTAYLLAAVAIFAQMIMILFLKAPPEQRDKDEPSKRSLKLLFTDSINGSLIVPFCDMVKKKEAFHLIIIILFYKSADFMMQNMSRIFLVEIGFSKIEIANAQLLGAIVVVVGGLVSGYIIKKIGLARAMFYFGVSHAVSFFCYTILLNGGAISSLLYLVISFEAFTGGCVTTAFVATFYITCRTGAMYALLWALHEISGIFFMGISGVMVDHMGWNGYFQLIPLTYLIVSMLCWNTSGLKSKPAPHLI